MTCTESEQLPLPIECPKCEAGNFIECDCRRNHFKEVEKYLTKKPHSIRVTQGLRYGKTYLIEKELRPTKEAALCKPLK